MNPERRATTGRPARRATHRLALIALACAAFGLEGCQSLQSANPFRNCAGCGPLSRIGNGNGNGLFNRNRGRVIYDEPPIVIDQAPGVEILPGSPVIVDPGVPVGGPMVSPDPGLTPVPRVAPPEDALELEPLPEPSGRAPLGTLNSRANPDGSLGARPIDRAPLATSGGLQANGDPYADRMARRSDVTLARPELDPVSGPGRAGPRPILAESLSVIDRLQSPEEFAATEGPIPAAVPSPPAEPAPAPAPPAEAPPTGPAADPSPPPTVEPSPPPPEATPIPETAPPIPEPQPDAGAASGIGSFHPVEPLLAGGSVPSEPGWAELVDRGYRTVLDLRPIEQVRPTDFATSSRAGLRHILLPTTPGRMDALLVRRFEEEITQPQARPIFFCDADGSTAAALWFVHLVAESQYDPDRARREAERIAPIPADLYLAARGYLDARNTSAPPDQVASASVLPPPPQAGPIPEAAPPEPPTVVAESQAVASPESPAVASAVDVPEPAPAIAPDPAPAEVSVAEVFEDPFARPSPIDPKGWGPYAALFLTILVVPLAYWSGLGIPNGFRTRARASLSAPGRRPQSLPAASDAGT